MSKKYWQVLLITLAATTLLIAMWLFGRGIDERMVASQLSWEEYNEASRHTVRHLIELEAIIGYSGLIHHFKNYLLRQEEAYYRQFKQGMERLKVLTSELRAHNMHSWENQQIDIIENTFAHYDTNIDLAKEAFAQGATISDVDVLVRISDQEAATALENLLSRHEHFTFNQEKDTRTAMGEMIRYTRIRYIFIFIFGLLFFSLLYFLRKTNVNRETIETQREFLNAMLEGAPDPILTINDTGFVVQGNSAAKRVFAYDEESLKQTHIRDIVPIRAPSAYKVETGRQDSENFSRYTSLPQRELATTRDGRKLAVEVSLGSITQNQQRYTIATIRDVSNQVAIEDNLRMSEERLITSQAIARVGTWDWLITQDEVIWSDEVYRIYEIDPHRVQASYEAYLERVHPHDVGKVQQAISDALNDPHKQQDVEHRILLPNGREKFVHIQSKVYRDEDNNPVRMLGVVHDISEYKKVEQELTNAKSTAERFLQISEAVIIGLDPDARITIINKHGCQLLGYSEKELLGENWIGTMVPLEDQERYHKAFKDFINLQPSEFVYFESKALTAHGHVLHFRWHNTLQYNQRGRVSGILSSGTDITRIKETEFELNKAKQIAEKASLAKSEFLANMSHEIRTPMNAIIGLGHLLSKSMLNERQRDQVGKINKSAESLLSIINDILDFSKIEAGKLEIEHTDFDLSEVYQHLSSMLSYQTQGKDLELLFKLNPEVPLKLRGDPLRLGQILLNLTGNAIKFTEQGEIVVSCRQHSQKNDTDSITLEFSVKDTGIGMSEEQLEKIFLDFSQADTSTTRRYGGTGLGLVISRKLVELMGGEISVESQLGQGSTFSFSIPFAAARNNGLSSRQYQNSFKGRNILLVDDNQTALDISAEIMASLGFSTHTCNSGEEALQWIEQVERGNNPLPDAILMDWKMLNMDGMQASKLIRKQLKQQGLEIPIFLLTAYYDTPWTREQLMAHGIRGVIEKPLQASVIINHLLESLPSGGDDRQMPLFESVSDEVLQQEMKGKKILVVEDNLINQMISQELLQEVGVEVDVADNGRLAVDILSRRNKDYDLVLMDIQMPEMDGYEASRYIRHELHMHSLPIIAMTAHAMQTDRELCLQAGMNDHVSKPIEVDSFFATLRHWLQDSRQGSKPALAISAPIKNGHEHGIDIDYGLQIVKQNQKLYIRLLHEYVHQNQGSIETMLEMAREQQWQKLREKAHGLKGVSSNIGALSLSNLTRDLEDTLGNDPDPEEVLNVLHNLRNELHISIEDAKNYIIQHRAPSSQRKQQEQGFELSRQLEALLEQIDKNSMQAIELFEKIQAHLGDTDTCRKLDASLHRLDFAQSAALVKTLIQHQAEDQPTP